jgi:AraC family transcriptional regulator, transcriptional activator of pobA
MDNTDSSSIERFAIEEYMAPDFNTNLNIFAMHFRKVKNDWFYPAHEHAQYEFNYTVKGSQIITINGKRYQQMAGDLILIHPGNIHFSEPGNENGFSYFCLHLEIDDPVLLQALNQTNNSVFETESEVNRQVSRLLERLIELTKQSQSSAIHNRMLLYSALFEFLASFGKAMANNHDVLLNEGSDKWKLAQLIAERIEQSLTLPKFFHDVGDRERITIEEIATEMGISISYCHRVFREYFNVSPRQYLSTLVLEKAKLLLKYKEMKMERISELLGYRNYANFSRQFKRWTGHSPKEYRQKFTNS